MLSALRYSLLACGILLAAPVMATGSEDRPDHYRGLAADTLEQALSHLQTYNAELQVLLQRERLDARDVDAVHRLTYTLENALERLATEVERIAAVLEEVHVASERLEADTVFEAGARYLEASAPLVGAVP